MLMRTLNLTEMPAYLDATDGLAAAVCHYYQTSNAVLGSGAAAGNWKSFLTQNPGRIK
jgi:crossover junction endodeoxyribonuclease RuvC